MKFNKETRKQLLEVFKEKRISLEGNILKIIDADGDQEFQDYINQSLEKDKENRRKRLDITRQVQTQNNELVKWKEENEKIQEELKLSLTQSEQAMMEAQRLKEEAESARESAEFSMIEAEKAKEEAIIAKEEALNAKKSAENDLDLVQKKSQFELIGTIVRVALYVILGVGVVTTAMYLFAILRGTDTQVIGSTWSNIIGILLTNAFSIVGTIMGVKYASEKSSSKEE
jgi:Fe2+ transport system protein B